MSPARPPDTPVADALRALEPARVPVQDVSTLARGPYDPGGQPRVAHDGFILGVSGWNHRPWPEGRALAAEAERLGLGLLVADAADGAEALDAFAACDAVAAETARAVLAPAVSLRAHLHPVHVARFVANLDHIANGRGALVFDAGDDAARARLFGLEPAAEPEAELDEFVTLVKHSWSWATPFDFEGRFYASRRNWLCGPRPTRMPRPWLALRGGEEALELAARSFDWLILSGATDVALARRARDRAALGYGRRLLVFATIEVTETSLAQDGPRIGALAGVEQFDGAVLRFADGLRGLHEFGAEALPALRANGLRWATLPPP